MRSAVLAVLLALALTGCARSVTPHDEERDAGLGDPAPDAGGGGGDAQADGAPDPGLPAGDGSAVDVPTGPAEGDDPTPEDGQQGGEEPAGDAWPAPDLALDFPGRRVALEVLDTNQRVHPYLFGQDFEYELWARIVNRSGEPVSPGGLGAHAFASDGRELPERVLSQVYAPLCVTSEGSGSPCVLPGDTFVLRVFIVMSVQPTRDDIARLSVGLYVGEDPLPADLHLWPLSVTLRESRDEVGVRQLRGTIRNDAAQSLPSATLHAFPQDASGRILHEYWVGPLLLTPGDSLAIEEARSTGPEAHSFLWTVSG